MDTAGEVARLLEDGLDHFGVGQVGQAIECWERVLRLDPGNRVARDYLDNARVNAEEGTGNANLPLLHDARKLMRGGQLEEALDHFQLATQLEGGGIEIEVYVDLLRAHLVKHYRARFGSLQRRPHIKLSPEQIARYNLSAGAGFLLSRLDGATSVGELVALSGMDAFEAFRILNRLLDAGIIGVAA